MKFIYYFPGRWVPVVEDLLNGATHRRLAQAAERAGFYGVTEDRHPLIGHWRGMVVCTGFGGHGVMHSPAAGLVASELVLHGEARSVDISSLSPDRFERGELVRETMVF